MNNKNMINNFSINTNRIIRPSIGFDFKHKRLPDTLQKGIYGSYNFPMFAGSSNCPINLSSVFTFKKVEYNLLRYLNEKEKKQHLRGPWTYTKLAIYTIKFEFKNKEECVTEDGRTILGSEDHWVYLTRKQRDIDYEKIWENNS